MTREVFKESIDSLEGFRQRLAYNANDFDTIVSDMLKALEYALADKEKWKTIADNYVKSEGAWRWQGDGEDHLESLTCSILIEPQQLRNIINARPTYVLIDAMSCDGCEFYWRDGGIYDECIHPDQELMKKTCNVDCRSRGINKAWIKMK